MGNKINISIPQPCHEDWETMTPVDRGRFCASCQKNVVDFTKASDREIINAFQKDNNLCGRFLNSQLNRDLVKPEKKNPIWLATVTAFISLFSLNEALSQEKAPTEQTDLKIADKSTITKTKIKIVGGILDYDLEENVPEVLIQIKGKDNVIYSNEKGYFEVNAEVGDVLVFSKKDFITYEVKVTDRLKKLNVLMENKTTIKPKSMGALRVYTQTTTVVTEKKRTLFGRFFHWVGNLFR